MSEIVHGTKAGFDAGCRSAGNCPGGDDFGLTCKVARVRYYGDFRYARRVDAGWSPAEIMAAEAAEELAARPVAVKKAKKAPAVRSAKTVAKRVAGARPAVVPVAAAPRAPVVQAAASRPAVIAAQKVLAKAGASLRAAQERLQVAHRAYVEAERALLDADAVAVLPVVVGPRPRGRVPKPCGTNAAYARGCRCELCREAGRVYRIAYLERRRAAGIRPDQHGTAFGYQLGCQAGSVCPASPSCSAVSLSLETVRRRRVGRPAAPVRVDSGPVLAHLAVLRAQGFSPARIAVLAGVNKSFVASLAYGRSNLVDGLPGPRHGEIPDEVEAGRAAAILAVEVPSVAVRD